MPRSDAKLAKLAAVENQKPANFDKLVRKLRYIEDKGDGLEGPARIGWVYYSKTGKTLYYQGLVLRSLKGAGFKANYLDVESGRHYWVSGVKKDGHDRLYGGHLGVAIDSDAEDAYWQLRQH